MNRKASIDLSFGTLIWLIIALLVLGFLLYMGVDLKDKMLSWWDAL